MSTLLKLNRRYEKQIKVLSWFYKIDKRFS